MYRKKVSVVCPRNSDSKVIFNEIEGKNFLPVLFLLFFLYYNIFSSFATVHFFCLSFFFKSFLLQISCSFLFEFWCALIMSPTVLFWDPLYIYMLTINNNKGIYFYVFKVINIISSIQMKDYLAEATTISGDIAIGP